MINVVIFNLVLLTHATAIIMRRCSKKLGMHQQNTFRIMLIFITFIFINEQHSAVLHPKTDFKYFKCMYDTNFVISMS